MYEYSFLISDVVMEFPKDELECTSEGGLLDDFYSFFSEASLPLCHLGVLKVDDVIIIYTDCDDSVERLEYLIYLVDYSCDMLDEITQGKRELEDNYSDEVSLYYSMFQSIGGDDTCFDYHGTFVQVILDALLVVAKKDMEGF